MRIRVTVSARAELLETVVRLRRQHRGRAARFVSAVEDRLSELATGHEQAPEMGSAWRAARAGQGHRLYLRTRGDTLWLLAVWPDPANREPSQREESE